MPRRRPQRAATGTALAALVLVGLLAGAPGASGGGARVSIVGGAPAAPGAFPWAVAIRASVAQRGPDPVLRHVCGGALITPRTVLTAAHCVTDEQGALAPGQAAAVVVGATDLRSPADDEIPVAAVERHPLFDRTSLDWDLALLRLERPAPQTPLGLARLARPLRDGARGTILGWGATRTGGPPSPLLRTARVALWASDRCTATFRRVLPGEPPPDPLIALCAAEPRGGVDFCDGDSGGPIVTRGAGGVWQLVGVVSWSIACDRRGLASVYAWAGSPFLRAWIVRRAAALAAADPDATRPALTRLALRGRQVRFTVSERSDVVLALARPGADRPIRAALTVQDAQGAQRVVLPRRLGGEALGPGPYTLRAVATDLAGNPSARATLRFRLR